MQIKPRSLFGNSNAIKAYTMEREDSNALKISWSCCFQRRKEGLIIEEEPTKLSETWDGGHDIEPSTKWNFFFSNLIPSP